MKRDVSTSSSTPGASNISAVLRLLGEVARASSVDELLPSMLDAVLALTGADVGAIFVEDGDDLIVRHHREAPEELLRLGGRRPKSDPVVQAAVRGTAVRDTAELGGPMVSALRSLGLRHAWTIPLYIGRKWFGFALVASTREAPLSAAGLEALPILCLQMGSVFQRLRSAEVQRRSERAYKEILDATSDALFLHHTRTTEILSVNRRMVEMFGFESEDEVLGLRVSDISEMAAPVAQQEALEQLRRAVTDGPQVFDWQCKRKDGTTFWAEVALRRSEISGDDRVLASVRDISDRRRIEGERLRAQMEYRDIFNATSEGIAIYDAQTGAIIDVNRALMEMHGFDDKDAALNVGVGELGQGKSPYSPAEAAEWFRKACEEGPQVFEWLGRRTNGESFWEEVSLRRSEIAGQDRVLSVVRDITERKEAEQERSRLEAQMHRAQRLESLGTLAGGVAHEFNNLLTGILGNASLLLSEPAPDRDAREAIVEIENAARNAADLVRQMLAYAGKETLVAERLELRRLVEGMRHFLEATISKKATLVYELGPEPANVVADPGQLGQVLVNLVTNSSESLADGTGIITIRTGVGGPRPALGVASRPQKPASSEVFAYLEVADTGQGMDAQTLERLFDPFFTTKFLGRGLGMAAVLGIVRGHQGRVEAQSEPGRGTTVRVVLPAAVEPGASEDKTPAGEEVGMPRVVLLVDDERAVQRIGRRMLERLGYAVVVATTGIEALEIFRATPDRFWCVLLDVSMPDLSGDEVLERLRGVRCDVRAIVCSGHDAQQVRERFAARPPAGFLRKPYDFAALRESLAQLEGADL